MSSFPGFPKGKLRLIPIPGSFFSQLLPKIDDLGELKVTLYTFWRLALSEEHFRFLRRRDYLDDSAFLRGLAADPEQAADILDEALKRAVQRGSLLRATRVREQSTEEFYFLNSPRGRAAVEAIRKGDWYPADAPQTTWVPPEESPNIFRLYEENIGPLTPMIAETLIDAESTYPMLWIEDAIRIAVENNVRRWRYVEAILRSWREEGRDERQPEGHSEKDRRRYVTGKFSEFIEH